MYTSSNDASILIWAINTTSYPKPTTFTPVSAYLNVHSDYITALHYNSAHQRLFSCSLDGNINVIPLSSNTTTTPSHTVIANKNSLYSLDVNSECTFLVASSYENELILYDMRTKNKLPSLYGHNDIIKKVRLSPDNKFAITVSSDKSVRLWDISYRKLILNCTCNKSSVVSLYVNEAFNKVITGNIEGEIHVFDLPSKQYSKMDDVSSAVLDVTMSDDNGFICASTRDGRVLFYNLKANDNEDDDVVVAYSQDKVIQLEEHKGFYGAKYEYVARGEIKDYTLTKNKCYVIAKYDDDNKFDVFNIVKGRKLPIKQHKANITYKELTEYVALKEKECASVSSWCNVDIKLGTLTITLNNTKCLDNDMTLTNANAFENWVQSNNSELNFNSQKSSNANTNTNTKQHLVSNSFGCNIIARIIQATYQDRINFYFDKCYTTINKDIKYSLYPFNNNSNNSSSSSSKIHLDNLLCTYTYTPNKQRDQNDYKFRTLYYTNQDYKNNNNQSEFYLPLFLLYNDFIMNDKNMRIYRNVYCDALKRIYRCTLDLSRLKWFIQDIKNFNETNKYCVNTDLQIEITPYSLVEVVVKRLLNYEKILNYFIQHDKTYSDLSSAQKNLLTNKMYQEDIVIEAIQIYFDNGICVTKRKDVSIVCLIASLYKWENYQNSVKVIFNIESIKNVIEEYYS